MVGDFPLIVCVAAFGLLRGERLLFFAAVELSRSLWAGTGHSALDDGTAGMGRNRLFRDAN